MLVFRLSGYIYLVLIVKMIIWGGESLLGLAQLNQCIFGLGFERTDEVNLKLNDVMSRYTHGMCQYG